MKSAIELPNNLNRGPSDSPRQTFKSQHFNKATEVAMWRRLGHRLRQLHPKHGFTQETLVSKLGCTAVGSIMKLMNFRRLDPEYTAEGKKGLTRGAKADEEVWAEFAGAPDRCRKVAQAIIAALDEES